MADRCPSWQAGSHASTLTPCSLCVQPAIFHWRSTYPDLLLCAECLESYPEAFDRTLTLFDPRRAAASDSARRASRS